MPDDGVEPEPVAADDPSRLGVTEEDGDPGQGESGHGHRVGAAPWQLARDTRVFVLVYAVAAVGLPLVYLDQPLHFDEGLFLTVGKRVAHGETLYADIADHKPPGIYLVAAAVYELGGSPIRLARGLTYTVTALAGLVVVALGRPLLGRSAAYGAGVLFVVASYLPHFDGFYFLTEPYAVLTMLVAAVLLGRDTHLANAAAGVSLGVGVLFNQTVLLFGGAILLYHLVRLRYRTARSGRALRRTVTGILTIGAGFLTVAALAVAALAAGGILRETLYYALYLPFTAYSTPFDARGHLLAVATLMPVWILAAGVVLRTGASVADEDPVSDRLLFVAVWAAVMSIPGMIGFAGDHKLLFAFPAVTILAVVGIGALYDELERPIRRVRTAGYGRPDGRVVLYGLFAAAVLSMTVVAGAGNVYYASNLATKDVADERDAVRAAVAGVDGPVYAYNVQGQVYVHTDVKPATTFLGTMYARGIAERKIDDLERDEVRYVLVNRVYVENGRVVPGTYWRGPKSIMTAYLNDRYEPTRSTDEWMLFERTAAG